MAPPDSFGVATLTCLLPSDGTERPPSRAEALEATWREYYRHAGEAPRHPAARDFLHQRSERRRWRG